MGQCPTQAAAAAAAQSLLPASGPWPRCPTPARQQAAQHWSWTMALPMGLEAAAMAQRQRHRAGRRSTRHGWGQQPVAGCRAAGGPGDRVHGRRRHTGEAPALPHCRRILARPPGTACRVPGAGPGRARPSAGDARAGGWPPLPQALLYQFRFALVLALAVLIWETVVKFTEPNSVSRASQGPLPCRLRQAAQAVLCGR